MANEVKSDKHWRWAQVYRGDENESFGLGARRFFANHPELTDARIEQLVGQNLPMVKLSGRRDDQFTGRLLDLTWYENGVVATWAAEGTTRIPPNGILEIDAPPAKYVNLEPPAEEVGLAR